MLVLTRKSGESIRIGDDVEVRVVSVRGQKVRLAIEAPREISVRRTELESQGREGQPGAGTRLRLSGDERLAERRRRAVS
jgi:carbon storage regulator